MSIENASIQDIAKLEHDESASSKKSTLSTKLDADNDAISAFQGNYSYHYQAAAADNVIIKASAGVLVGIIIGGLPIANASIEISDHASDGDGNIVAHPSGGDASDNLLQRHLKDLYKGYIPIGMAFATGITVDQIAQTKCTYIFY